MTEESDDDDFDADIKLVCPFCRGVVMADASEGKVMHTMPACSEFEALEPDDFLVAVRKKMSN